jgi:ADP-heptose:LPS heptosyltransferase
MRVVLPERSIKWHEVSIEAGKKYVLEPKGAVALLSKIDGLGCLEPVQLPPYFPNSDYNHQTLTIFRAGGIGDILMLTPLLQAMNERWPEAHLEVCCGSRSRFALPSFVDWLPYPALLTEIMERDSVLNLTDVIENEFELHGVHAFGGSAGFADLPLRLSYQCEPSLVRDMGNRYPRRAKHRVGIQVRSSSPIRNYPPTGLVMDGLVGKGIEVVLFGDPNSIIVGTPHELILNGTAEGWDMEDSLAMLTLCDCLIAPDSSFIHFGCALHVPTIGIFGSFDHGIRRTEGHPKNYWIQAKGECSPCNHHGKGGEAWPLHGPCRASGYCNVLAAIPVDRIVRKAVQICNQ